jgi:hypothetical protein
VSQPPFGPSCATIALMLLLKFFDEFRKELKALVTGSLLLGLLGLYQAISRRNVSWWVYAVITVFFLGWAFYGVWRREYLRAEAETAKNLRPQIRGKAIRFAINQRQFVEGTEGHRWHTSFGVSCALDICNWRPVKTNWTNIILDGSRLSPKLQCSEISLAHMDRELEQGIGKTIPVNFVATIMDRRRQDLAGTAVEMKNLLLEIVDGFGNPHQIQIGDGESISFS